jgi:hypothetical protein
MSRELLCTWLDVSATPWPPSHYALLGLAPGEGAAEEVEQRVLERMERLRHYQLTHPDLVTEGMNLLAQAMICLTDPVARREYDRPLGVGPPAERSAPPTSAPAQPPASRREPAAEPQVPVLEFEPEPVYSLDESETRDGEPMADAIIIPELAEESLPLPDEAEAEPDDFDERPLPEIDEQWVVERVDWVHERRKYRRRLYAELVRIRRVLHIWEQLRSYLDEPEKAFSRRTDTVAFMNLLADLRPLLASVQDLVGSSGQAGNLIAVLSRQQLVVEMFRSLLPSQRDALARDCQAAHYVLMERYRDIRDELRTLTAKGFRRRIWWPMLRQMIARPEWFLLMIGVAALAIAFLRSMPQ